ncbi:MAG: aminoacetone oxidase family FAD-binding enzyme [Lachnospiraceae bacterium]|uniref:Aminoacetone oxidase family FAD-binding enzyme n=1 Tax=Candidatus Weimeria bifida TaxID=2599074 RepID=A0A6N7IWP5_9FIRM|nr:aminoacetone oxidase family FAD-binding enzyme [Candidatus Weimeria bifida]RRF96059.1 MAG: aminoacetone oxidase family FAD-binding enzyme [Lachnospiraceae bacterium]
MKIIIVGAGAAGLAAAVSAAEKGADVTILERNEKAGKKIYITGKGRCNFTNAAPIDDFYQNIVTNPRFLYSAFAYFNNQDLKKFIEDAGVPTKVERGGRMFPQSDHASDITRAFTDTLKKLKVKIIYNTRVLGILCENGKVTGVRAAEEGHLSEQKEYLADAVILAAGGKSYPTTGSDGNLIPVLKDMGLDIKPCYPALVPFETKEEYIPKMQGLSLKNIEFKIFSSKKKKPIYSEFGEMLFTHFGISGPVVISASSKVAKVLEREGELKAEIDLKPALSDEKLNARLIRTVEEGENKNFSHFFDGLLPSKMIPVMVGLTEIDPEKKLNSITKQERAHILTLLKHFPLTITGTRGFNEAISTGGGLSVKEVDPKTMQLKKYPGLFACGEMLDVDALTGGYNLQSAFSMGALAGCSAAKGGKDE